MENISPLKTIHRPTEDNINNNNSGDASYDQDEGKYLVEHLQDEIV